ncbi:hypothetical protein KY289_017696 [Solanum tuberosum]|nr:hypothetical protein KY289_017696 [Solanum tuberosum]
MLEGVSPLSDPSASSYKSAETIAKEPHAGKPASLVLLDRLAVSLATTNRLPSAKERAFTT